MQKYFNTENERYKILLKIIDEAVIIKDIISGLKDRREATFIYLERNRYIHNCPRCNSKTDTIHDYRIRKIKHYATEGLSHIIIYRQRRYRCKCGKRFNEENFFVDKWAKISNALKQCLFADFKRKGSFTDTSSRYNVSTTTSFNVFNKHIKQPRRDLPEVLSIDEFKGNASGNKYLVSLVDPINANIIDILKSRYKSDLKVYFNQIPVEERLNVKFFITDMWNTYKDIAELYFPNATIIADKFHYIRHIYWAMNNIRVRFMKKLDKNTLHYKFMKKYWKLFVMRSEKISSEIKINYRKNQVYSPQQLLDDCLDMFPELRKAYRLKEEFYNIIDNCDSSNVKVALIDWAARTKSSYITEFRDAYNTVLNWLDEIENSFIINENTNKKYTNGYIEGTNNFIKSLKRVAYGFRNFETFRNVIMYKHKRSQNVITG